MSQPFFTLQDPIIVVSGHDMQVNRYENVTDANAEVDLVAPDGSSVGISIKTWIATAHFFRGGKDIVLLVGDQNDTIDILEGVHGSQFAGG